MADITGQLANVYYGINTSNNNVTVSFGQPENTDEITYLPMIYISQGADNTNYPEWFEYVHLYMLKLIVTGDDPGDSDLSYLSDKTDNTWVDSSWDINQLSEVPAITQKDFKFLMDLWKWSQSSDGKNIYEDDETKHLDDVLKVYLESKEYTSQISSTFEAEYDYAKIYLDYDANTETQPDYFGKGEGSDLRREWIQKNIIAKEGSLGSINPILEDSMFNLAQYKKLVGQYAKLIATGFEYTATGGQTGTVSGGIFATLSKTVDVVPELVLPDALANLGITAASVGTVTFLDMIDIDKPTPTISQWTYENFGVVSEIEKPDTTAMAEKVLSETWFPDPNLEDEGGVNRTQDLLWVLQQERSRVVDGVAQMSVDNLLGVSFGGSGQQFFKVTDLYYGLPNRANATMYSKSGNGPGAPDEMIPYLEYIGGTSDIISDGPKSSKITDDIWDFQGDSVSTAVGLWDLIKDTFEKAGDLSSLEIPLYYWPKSVNAKAAQGKDLLKNPIFLDTEQIIETSFVEKFSQKVLSSYTDKLTFGQIFRETAYRQAEYLIVAYAKSLINKRVLDVIDVIFKIAEGATAAEAGDLLNNSLKDLKGKAQEAAEEMEEAEISDSEVSKRQKLLGQCLLLTNLSKLNKEYQTKLKNLKGTPKSIHQADFFDGRFFNVIDGAGDAHNTLSQIKSKINDPVGEFSNLPPSVQALLVPLIRIEKVHINESGTTVTTEIPFQNYTRGPQSKQQPLITYQTSAFQGSSLLSGTGVVTRGGACGIKSVSFEFDGETPATAEKYVKSKMSLFFQDFKTLIEERATIEKYKEGSGLKTDTTFFRYLDLIVNPLNNKVPPVAGRESLEHYDPSYYRIKLTVGWNLGDGQGTIDACTNAGINHALLKESLSTINKTFMMCALDHELNVTNEGAIELSINYRGYGDTLLRSRRFNALIPYSKQQEFINLQLKYEKTISNNSCTMKQRSEYAATMAGLRKKEADKAYSNILESLFQNKAVYSATLSGQNADTALAEFENQGSFTFVPPINTSIPVTNLTFDTKSRSDLPNTTIHKFFFLGDLLYVLLDCIYDGTSGEKALGAENVSFILTDFAFREWLPNKPAGEATFDTKAIPLASVPITVDYFRSWFAKTIIGNDISNMPVLDFILSLANDLCGCMLSEICFSSDDDRSIMFRQANILADKSLRKYSKKNPFIKASAEVFPLTLSPDTMAHNLTNYTIIYVDTPPKTAARQGVQDDDKNVGIPWFKPGRSRGLVKNVSWAKTNIGYLRESRAFSTQGLGDFAQLANVYNVSMKMFGNFLLFPGMQVYIDPYYLGGSSFGNPSGDAGRETTGIAGDSINFARLMGIGGYHLVTSVQAQITPQKFETTVEARFLYNGDTTQRLKATKNAEPDDIDAGTDEAEAIAACNAVIVDLQESSNNEEGVDD